MDLYKEILWHILQENAAQAAFSGFPASLANLMQMQCYQVLQEIKSVICDERLDDPACFHRIEKIVQSLEDSGIDTGTRHDF